MAEKSDEEAEEQLAKLAKRVLATPPSRAIVRTPSKRQTGIADKGASRNGSGHRSMLSNVRALPIHDEYQAISPSRRLSVSIATTILSTSVAQSPSVSTTLLPASIPASSNVRYMPTSGAPYSNSAPVGDLA